MLKVSVKKKELKEIGRSEGRLREKTRVEILSEGEIFIFMQLESFETIIVKIFIKVSKSYHFSILLNFHYSHSTYWVSHSEMRDSKWL